MADSASREPRGRRGRQGRAGHRARVREIGDWRQRIDELDKELVKLLNQRTRCASAVGRLKRRAGVDIRHPEREKAILARVQKLNRGPLSDEAVKRLFERILHEARRVARQGLKRKKKR